MNETILKVFIVLMLAVSFFGLFVLPRINKKKYEAREKEIKDFQSGLKKDDDVLTAIGIYGKIKEIRGNVVSLQVDDGTTLQVDSSIIVGKTKKSFI